MNTMQALKKCIQIDLSEYTLFLNTSVLVSEFSSIFDVVVNRFCKNISLFGFT